MMPNFWQLATNSQNSIILFDYSWFLAENLSNFVSLPWKLHNWYCGIAITDSLISIILHLASKYNSKLYYMVSTVFPRIVSSLE